MVRILVTAVAGFGGAVIGASATLIAGALQHRRETENEISRESRMRALEAAEKCHELFSEFVRAYERCHSQDNVRHAFSAKMMKVNGEIVTQTVFLPGELRVRLHRARTVMVSADDITEGRYHYLPPSTIVRYSASEAQSDLVAYMRSEPYEDVGPRMRELEIALREYHDDYSEASADHYKEFNAVTSPGRSSHSSRWTCSLLGNG